MNHQDLYLGLDVGSVSVKAVLVDSGKRILHSAYRRHAGKPIESAAQLILELLDTSGCKEVRGLGVTGGGGKAFVERAGGVFVNEVVAQSMATRCLHPDVRTVIEIGGEDSKLIFMFHSSNEEKRETEKKDIFGDFAMNTVCAAGTGSFLDQQAARLGLSVEELGKLALQSKSPPRVAGRCSVFAKSDMIHLQQKGTPSKDIVAGLCHALARNFKSTVGAAREFEKPVSFQGGVAANPGIVQALETVLGLSAGELVIPEYFAIMGSIGAALIAEREAEEAWHLDALDGMTRYEAPKVRAAPKLVLSSKGTGEEETRAPFSFKQLDSSERVRAYLGIDIGSISTCLAVLDEDLHLLGKRYLMTAGEPIEAVKKGLREIGEEVGSKVEIASVCTTGSGRYLIADFVGADVVRNEITAQARAAVAIDPDVDTVFEIGGQDSKYISLQEGIVVDFEMNKVCAAGTGSFLEEQAEKLQVKIKEQFGDLALSAEAPSDLGERCTVFMESELVRNQQIGVPVQDLVAGLCYSVVHNYLNKVVASKRVGKNILFQGGVAFNDGVVAAFESVVGRPIKVPAHNEVTGAIGCALIAKENAPAEGSRFKGFSVADRSYDREVFECQDCPNHCEISKVSFEGEEPLYYGSRCEKYEKKENRKADSEVQDHFKERERLLHQLDRDPSPGKKRAGAPRVGLPQALHFHELFPLWYAMLNELGAEVILSGRTTKRVIHRGAEQSVAETCFPMKIALGHVLELLDQDLDFLFMPSVINLPTPDSELTDSFLCPYVQSLPYTFRSAVNPESRGTRVLVPKLHLQLGEELLVKRMRETAELLGCSDATLRKAVRKGLEAQRDFVKAREALGRQVLDGLREGERALVIVSRPYNGCDAGASMEIPEKLRRLGIQTLPMDCLPVEEAILPEEWKNMYWRYGQRILAAARLISEDPRLFPVYITNFGCGPDSFLMRYFRRMLGDKPCLVIEVDEHSADAGIVTRCEAYLDSLETGAKDAYEAGPSLRKVSYKKDVTRRTLYLPNMSCHAFALAAAFEGCGMKAEVLPEPDEEALEYGRKVTTGKECLPCVVTTGEMVKKAKSPDFDPDRSAFFMGGSGGPCRFGQYNALQRMVLDELGHKDVPIFAPNQSSSFFKDMGLPGRDLIRRCWRAVVASDLLEKCVREYRPYEVNEGQSERVFEESLEEICRALRAGEKMIPVLVRMRDRFAGVEREGVGEKPVVGIVGEFYIRQNRFSSQDLTGAIERLGGATWMAPSMEWFLYRNMRRGMRSWLDKDLKLWLNNLTKDWYMRREEKRFSKPFHGFLEYDEEPPAETILRLAAPYLDRSFEGEAIVTIGKAIDFLNKGLDGIVSVMPFTCMPGTVGYIIAKRVREDRGGFPYLNMVYDGMWQPTADSRLEAFMHQAKERHSGKRLQRSG